MSQPHTKDVVIETTLPKPWEQEETFNDTLYDWMSRAPWLGISAGAHLVIFLIIQAIPWTMFDQPEDTVFTARHEEPEQVLDDPPE